MQTSKTFRSEFAIVVIRMSEEGFEQGRGCGIAHQRESLERLAANQPIAAGPEQFLDRGPGFFVRDQSQRKRRLRNDIPVLVAKLLLQRHSRFDVSSDSQRLDDLKANLRMFSVLRIVECRD